MATKSHEATPSSSINEPFPQMHTQGLETLSAFAQANRAVVGELIDLSSTAAKEGFRTYAELQSAALEAVRASSAMLPGPRESVDELPQDPFGWYRRTLLNAADGTQRMVRLFETNAQIVARSAERFQASAERAGKDIQEAVSSYMDRVKEIYARN